MSECTKHQLSTILKRLMIECDVDDTKLSHITGVPFTTIARMRANKNANPTASSLRPIAKYFGISISQLLGDEPLSPERLLNDTHNTQRIPLIPWQKIFNWATDHNASHDDIRRWVSIDLPLSPGSFATKIENRAFGEPFNEHNILIVDPSATPVSKDYVLIQIEENSAVLLKEIMFDGDHVYLKSVNPELTHPTHLQSKYTLCGVVVEVRQQCHFESFSKVKPKLESSFHLTPAIEREIDDILMTA